MIEQGLFKRYFVGRDGFIWWIGQIAPESTWKDNKPAGPVGSNGDMQGFGERYRVRIMGYHTADVDSLQMKNYHGHTSCIQSRLVQVVEEALRQQI